MIVKFRTRITAALAALAVVAVGMSPTVSAAPRNSQLSIPVVGTGPTGTTFAGTMTLTSFAVQDVDGTRRVVARGILTGIATDAAGVATTVVSTFATPISVAQTSVPQASAVQALAACTILHLDLAPLYLGVLGLDINLSQVVLDLTAHAGAGQLLGNLLCAVAGLLDGPGTLGAAARILNQILDILAGL
jgi:hypothetical protein